MPNKALVLVAAAVLEARVKNRWFGNPEPADEQLEWGIDEFRERKIDAINAQLR